MFDDLRNQIRYKLFEEESMENEEKLAEAILEELISAEQEKENSKFDFNEENVRMLRNAFLAGFLSSDSRFNGSESKAVYKDSALKPGGVVWNEKLRTRFKRFVSNMKRKEERKNND